MKIEDRLKKMAFVEARCTVPLRNDSRFFIHDCTLSALQSYGGGGRPEVGSPKAGWGILCEFYLILLGVTQLGIVLRLRL